MLGTEQPLVTVSVYYLEPEESGVLTHPVGHVEVDGCVLLRTVSETAETLPAFSLSTLQLTVLITPLSTTYTMPNFLHTTGLTHINI